MGHDTSGYRDYRGASVLGAWGWNDRLGHAMGDQILRRVAEEMNLVIRETDFLARYGGEEVALLASCSSISSAKTGMAKSNATADIKQGSLHFFENNNPATTV